MTIKQRIRNWLGVADLVTNQQMLFNELGALHNKFDRMAYDIKIITPGLGRVIAKLDAKYAESELTPERKAESDSLGEEVIKRLYGEAAARAPYNVGRDNE